MAQLAASAMTDAAAVVAEVPEVPGALPSALAARAGCDTILTHLCSNTRACVLRPYCFFVSWQGVLTLAYRGFPAPLAALKAALTDQHAGLPPESPGSRWPKTSLACLREGARLTPAQLVRLGELCREHSGIFQAPGALRAQAVLVDSLSVVLYEARCLERVISRHVLPLASPPDAMDAPPEEAARVEAVVAEADEPGYWYHASRDGNREKHYRGPALGATLVHELSCFRQPSAAAAGVPRPGGSGGGSDTGTPTSGDMPAAAAAPSRAAAADRAAAWSVALPGILTRFQAAVEVELPGMYAFFAPGSLHVTVRALIV